MFRTRPILGFLCRFILVFGLLVAPWPGWKDLYARFLRNSATTILGTFGSRGIHRTVRLSNDSSVAADFVSFGSKAIVAFAPNPMGDKNLDTIVYIANRDQAVANREWSVKGCAFSSRFLAYLPTVLVIALVLATDLGGRRRLYALAWGLLLIHLFISFQLVLVIVVKLFANPELAQFEPSLFCQKLVSWLYQSFVEHIGTNLAMAVPVWILATFRRNDWARLLERESDTGKPTL